MRRIEENGTMTGDRENASTLDQRSTRRGADARHDTGRGLNTCCDSDRAEHNEDFSYARRQPNMRSRRPMGASVA
jgi:hypothetical protein